MQGIPTIRLKRLKRTALLVGAGTLVAGASLLGGAQAHALTIIGTQFGGVTLSPASGSTTGAVTYSSTACPTGFQGSGLLRIVDPATGGISNLAAVNNSVASAFTGTLSAGVLNTEATAIFTDLAGTQSEFVIYCFSGASATGSSEAVQYNGITISSDAATYVANQTINAGPVNTTTNLTASPSPATVGSTVTLTATVSPSNAAGTVQFEVGGTAINSPVTVASGVATTTTTFAAAGTEALSAVFTPTSTTAFNASTGTASLTVTTAQVETGTIPLAVSVPSTGAFTLTVDTTDTVTLAVTTAGTDATAATTPIVVSDTRNTYPGWSVSGQDPNGFTGSASAAGATMSGNQLGWTPTNSGTLPQGVTLGSAVPPANPGLGTTAAVLASVHAGLNNGVGTSTLGANLDLLFPAGQAAGPYTGGLTITAVGANP
jgi:hypothetical protein